jgi:ribonuclease G
VGVSKRLPDGERQRVRKLIENVDIGGGGVIVRTAAQGAKKEDFVREIAYLHRLNEVVEERAAKSNVGQMIFQEADLSIRVVRDVLVEEFEAAIIDDPKQHDRVTKFLQRTAPELADSVELYKEKTGLLEKWDVQKEFDSVLSRRVDLPSGGYLIIEPTEALVSVDVNTGRYTGKRDPEKTILKTNLDAAREVARQLRLRDIGGIIVVDFIDMESKANQDRVLQELRTYLNRDRARTRAFQVSELGLVEMTRQRVRPSLYYSLTEPCAHCEGAGRVFTPESVVRRIERALRRAAANGGDRRLALRVHPQVALHVLEHEPDFLRRMAANLELKLEIRDDPLMKADEFRLLVGPAATDVTAKYGL